MRAWERMEGESAKAWYAFQIYRDMGPERSLRAVAEAVYGERSKYGKRTVEKWSSRFDWVDRVRALDARDEMLFREKLEEHEAGRHHEYAERLMQLRERELSNSEQASQQEETILGWPLSERRVTKDEDGEQVTYVFMPARWSKATAVSMRRIACEPLTGSWGSGADQSEDDMDLSGATNEELDDFLRLAEKLGIRF